MLARGPALFDDLARSICPAVYGCDNVKKAILLMLMGGVHKVTTEVRGNAVGQHEREGGTALPAPSAGFVCRGQLQRVCDTPTHCP